MTTHFKKLKNKLKDNGNLGIRHTFKQSMKKYHKKLENTLKKRKIIKNSKLGGYS